MPEDLVQSLPIGLQLLDELWSNLEGLTLQGAGGLLGVQPSIAHNLWSTLVEHGYACQSIHECCAMQGPGHLPVGFQICQAPVDNPERLRAT